MIDAHHHLWRYQEADYGWIPSGSVLAQDFLIPELEAATASAGVSGTVVVQARQIVEESDWLLSLADQTEIIRGVVGWVPLVDSEVEPLLERLASHQKFKGVRHVLQEEPDDYFLREDFHRGLSRLPFHGLRYDLLLFQRQLSVALELVDRQPELGIVIDHIAKPVIRNGQVDPDWKRGMAELARRDHVLGVKISGMVTEVVEESLDEATLRAYFETTLELFGADRLMFGTDWPVALLRIRHYQDWARTMRGFVQTLSGAEQQAILAENAMRVYRL